MTFKALLYKCYTRKGAIGAGSKGQGARMSPEQSAFLPALRFNNK